MWTRGGTPYNGLYGEALDCSQPFYFLDADSEREARASAEERGARKSAEREAVGGGERACSRLNNNDLRK